MVNVSDDHLIIAFQQAALQASAEEERQYLGNNKKSPLDTKEHLAEEQHPTHGFLHIQQKCHLPHRPRKGSVEHPEQVNI